MTHSTILVTGAQGYIGRHVVCRLLQAGCSVIGVDLPGKISPCQFKDEKLIGVDLRNRATTLEVFRAHPINAVIHLASLIEVGESIRHPLRYYDDNLTITFSLLDAMEKTGVNRIIFASSAATYGISSGDQPIDEKTPQLPINPYGMTKLVIEQILGDLTRFRGLCAISLRLFNVAGRGLEKDGLQQVPQNMALIIPMLRKIAREKRQITTDEYARLGVLAQGAPTPDGTVIRDYVHVSDVAEAFYLSAKSSLEKNTAGAFVIASGVSYSILDVIRAAEKVTGHHYDIQWKTVPDGFPTVLKADTTRARETLGFIARHTDLEDTIRSS